MGTWTIDQLGKYDFDKDHALSEDEIRKLARDLYIMVRMAAHWIDDIGLHMAFEGCDKDKSGAIPLDEGVNCFNNAVYKLSKMLHLDNLD